MQVDEAVLMRNQTEIFLNFVKDGDIAEVRLLLDQGIDANSYLLDGEETALQVAVEHGHIDIVQLLLDKGASISIEDDGGWNLLSTAVDGGRLDILQLLLGRGASIDLITGDDSVGQLMYNAVVENDPDIVRCLLDSGVDVDILIRIDSCRFFNGRSLLAVALENDNVDMVRILLDRGASIDLITSDDCVGQLMYEAVKENDPDMVRCLLDAGVDVDILIKPVRRFGASIKRHNKRFPNQHSRETALSHAVSYGLHELMWLLLDRGAAMDKKLIDSAHPLISEAIRVEEEWRRVRNYVQFLHMSGFSSQQWSVRYPDIVEGSGVCHTGQRRSRCPVRPVGRCGPGGGGDAVRARPVASSRQLGNVLHNRDLCRIISGYIPNVYYNDKDDGGGSSDANDDDDNYSYSYNNNNIDGDDDEDDEEEEEEKDKVEVGGN